MSFHTRHYPEDVTILEKKLLAEGSHYFYNMYVKRVDCWAGNSKTKDSEKFIEEFLKKYKEGQPEFRTLDWNTNSETNS